MSWEYLGKETDYRMLVVAGYICNHIKDKIIVDLNCLEGRILNYIPYTFKKYLGNDIINRFKFKTDECIKFYNQSDSEFIKMLNKIDILLALGHGGYELSPNNKESQTLTNSIKYIMKFYNPEFVILEAAEGIYSTCIDNIAKDCNYIIDFNININNRDNNINQFYYNRNIICLRHPNKFINTI